MGASSVLTPVIVVLEPLQYSHQLLYNIVFINAYLQLFHELYDETCIYFLYVYYVLHVLVTILLQSANQINASVSLECTEKI